MDCPPSMLSSSEDCWCCPLAIREPFCLFILLWPHDLNEEKQFGYFKKKCYWIIINKWNRYNVVLSTYNVTETVTTYVTMPLWGCYDIILQSVKYLFVTHLPFKMWLNGQKKFRIFDSLKCANLIFDSLKCEWHFSTHFLCVTTIATREFYKK